MKYYKCKHMNTRLGRWVGHLVPAEHDVRGGGVGVRGELVQPVPGAQQGLVARQVEHQQEPHRVPEEEGPRVPSTCQVSRVTCHVTTHLKKAVVRLRNLSWPAVSHSCSWIRWLRPCHKTRCSCTVIVIYFKLLYQFLRVFIFGTSPSDLLFSEIDSNGANKPKV